MKIYFAGADSKPFRDIAKDAGAENILVSYFALPNNTDIEEMQNEFNVFLDSGAFSADTQDVEINLDEYIKFIKKHEVKNYVNLDVIGDHEATEENLQKMEDEGLTPLPVFHYGSPLEILNDYKDRYDFFALGGLVPYAQKPKKLRNWLNKCFKELYPDIKDNGLKVHGFGIGNPNILKRYPFYSVDSTSWLAGGKFGRMMKWDDFQFRSNLHYRDKESVVNNNVDVKALDSKNYQARLKHNIKELIKIEEDITKLWEQRGVSFN